MPESPYIALSELRELWKHVRMLEARKTQVTYHDVWLWLVRNELHRRHIAELQLKLYQAANYKGLEAYSCPLCTYEDGKFIKHCEMHKQIEELTKAVECLLEKIGATKVEEWHKL